MKKLILAALITAAFAAGTSCGKKSSSSDTEYIYGRIDSVSGNDIVLLLADYDEDGASADSEDSEAGENESGKKSDRSKGGKSKGFKKPESGEAPEGFDPEKFSGEIPEGFKKPENGEAPEGFDPEKFKGERPAGSRDGEKSERVGKNGNYSLTGEQEELRIPVGTDVTTSQGVKTDFDALSKGDVIKCSIEKNGDGEDVVTEIWILE